MNALGINACSVSVDTFSSLKALSFFKNYRNTVYNFIGIHPEYATLKLGEFENIFYKNIDLIDGLGEIGIDPQYSKQNPKNTIQIQSLVFKRMLEMAEKFDKPISIHSRNSIDMILDILSSYTIGKACFHWFDGSIEQLFRVMDKGYYVSYSPAVTHSTKNQELLKQTIIDKLLVETDGPVRYRGCFRDIVTSPISMLVSLVYFVSGILGLTFEDIANQISQNSKSFFE
jgi:TatD DNase family protein